MTSSRAAKYGVDVAAYNPGLAPTSPSIIWTPFRGITDFDPKASPTNEDVTDYDSNGWTDNERTALSAAWTIKARRPFNAGVYDPGQEIVRKTQILLADQARVFCRYYDRNLGPEARTGVFTTEWSNTKTGATNVEEITVALTSSGQVFDITNPYSAAVIPTIVSVSPAGKAAGQAVVITGSGFSGTVTTTGVKFGGTNATDFTVLSDTAITAVLPAGAAGATPVLVTNATGPSAAFSYTRA